MSQVYFENRQNIFQNKNQLKSWKSFEKFCNTWKNFHETSWKFSSYQTIILQNIFRPQIYAELFF